ncbi:hypothetical protein QJS66_02930 [Kocuria rhizophila]|nr:hypothetical protein QJS66_02930 [Kocuria rhizophila]
MGGEFVKGFHEESDIPADFADGDVRCLRVDVDDRRWAGVPLLPAAGKQLGRGSIAVAFEDPDLLFRTRTAEFATIVIRCHRTKGVTIRFSSKVPGTQSEIRDVTMDFGYGHAFTESARGLRTADLRRPAGEPPLLPTTRRWRSWKILRPSSSTGASTG